MTYSSLDDFLARASDRLDPLEGAQKLAETGDMEFVDAERIKTITPAAVLVPIIPRVQGPTVLLTQRPETMAAHPGQVAFPGGKVDPGDASVVAAALREAEEEVGADPNKIELIARAAPYVTATAYRITPVIGVLPHDFVAVPDPTEVAHVFETPLEFVFEKSNHQQNSLVWQGKRREFTEMPWQGFRIWGVTAGIIRDLYETLYES